MTFQLTTFVFELVNFVVLVFLMQRLVYRPLRRGLAERREMLESAERKAKERIAEAEKERARYERERRELAELREQTLVEASEEAAEQRARILAQARQDSEAERARVRRLLDAEREVALAWVRQLAVERGTEVAGQLLLQLAPEAIEVALFDRMCREIERRDLSGVQGAEPEVEVTAAAMPDDKQVRRLRASLERALGRPGRLGLREDESLGAGLVVRVGQWLLDGSLAGQLDAFRDQVKQALEQEAEVA